MSLVHEMLQDLDARGQSATDDLLEVSGVLARSLSQGGGQSALNVVTHAQPQEEMTAVLHASGIGGNGNSRPVDGTGNPDAFVEQTDWLPSRLASSSLDGEDLGRRQLGRGHFYLISLGVIAFIAVLAFDWWSKQTSVVKPALLVVAANPSEQVLMAELPDGFETPVSTSLSTPELLFSSAPLVSIEPLLKVNKVAELQTRLAPVIAVQSASLLEQVSGPLENNTPETSASGLSELPNAANADLTVTPISIETRVQALAENATRPAVELTATENKQTQITQLMTQASRAFDLQRYREPREDNAFDLYLAVLALQPDYAAASAGVVAIQQAYLDLIHRVIVKNHYYKVPALAKNARLVGVTQAEIDGIIAALPVEKSGPVQDALTQTRDYETQKQARAEQLSPSPQGGGTVSFSEQTRDKQVTQQAQKLIAEGHLPAAEILLKNYVDEQRKPVTSLQALFGLYLQQQKLTQAEALITRAQHLRSEQFSYLVAQLLIQRGDLPGAMRSLTSQQPELESNPSYYALMAALYHKLDQDLSAQAIYQRLVKLHKNNPSYWLGLAMARDGLQSPAALQAFRQVHRLSPASASYRAYVEQRISALSELPN